MAPPDFLSFSERLRAIVTLATELVRRLGYLLLSLLCGVAIPLSTLSAERVLRGSVADVAWFSVAVTYVAGVGLASRSRQVLLFMLVFAAGLAFLYGVDMEDEVHRLARRFPSD